MTAHCAQVVTTDTNGMVSGTEFNRTTQDLVNIVTSERRVTFGDSDGTQQPHSAEPENNGNGDNHTGTGNTGTPANPNSVTDLIELSQTYQDSILLAVKKARRKLNAKIVANGKLSECVGNNETMKQCPKPMHVSVSASEQEVTQATVDEIQREANLKITAVVAEARKR